MEEDHSEEDLPTEELVEANDVYIEVLMEVLKDKGIFTQEEFDKKLDELYPDDDNSDEEK